MDQDVAAEAGEKPILQTCRSVGPHVGDGEDRSDFGGGESIVVDQLRHLRFDEGDVGDPVLANRAQHHLWLESAAQNQLTSADQDGIGEGLRDVSHWSAD